jgi:membrane-bound lytic murein transglycosylase B
MRLSTLILAAAMLASTAPLALAQTNAQPAAAANTNHTLASAPAKPTDTRQTMSRRQVEELQAALQGNGAKNLAVDGILGKQTTQALRDYQKQHGLRTTGRFDHATAEKLTLPHWNA